jgi:hypothetical protein
MTKQKTLMLAMAGAALVLASQANAQTFGYSTGDLLLNFRVVPASGSPASGNDLEFNEGSVSGLTSVSGSQELVTPGTVASDLGVSTISSVGFSAGASDPTGNGLLDLTRVDTTPGVQPTTPSSQQQWSTQNKVDGSIDNIGAGANASTTILAQGVATVPAATVGLSYQAQGEASSSVAGQASITYGGNQNIVASKGGLIETKGASYLALWEVPATTTPGGASTGLSDTYLGYFTFQSDGEVDFNSAVANSPVPEPATYAMFAGAGLAALALRRQLRSFIA